MQSDSMNLGLYYEISLRQTTMKYISQHKTGMNKIKNESKRY